MTEQRPVEYGPLFLPLLLPKTASIRCRECLSRLRVLRKFLHAPESVPLTHGDFALNQEIVGIMDDTVHNGIGKEQCENNVRNSAKMVQ